MVVKINITVTALMNITKEENEKSKAYQNLKDEDISHTDHPL